MTSTTQANKNPNWQYEDAHKVLIACVGHNFGPNPEENLDEIRRGRQGRGVKVIQQLQLNASHDVADLGSGCGFVDRPIAPKVKTLTCIDISPSFLNYCKNELSSFTNVAYCLAKYGKFPGIDDASLDAIFSTAVFIHFNYYDFVIYLREIARVLRENGTFLVEILNADVLHMGVEAPFVEHLRNYPSSRETHIFNVLQPFSLTALRNLAPQIGFFVERVEFLNGRAITTVLLRKA